MKKLLALLYALAFVFGLNGFANATLWDRGGGLIYDDVFHVTWLQDANYAYNSGYWQTLPYSVPPGYQGLMLMNDALTWARNLEYYDPVRDTTWTDWRLYSPRNPETGLVDLGYNAAGEMGHLFYQELGNTAGLGAKNSGPFVGVNAQSNIPIWSNEWFSSGGQDAVYFSWASGLQYYKDAIPSCSDCMGQAWAVRDGDVSPVPEPASMLLLASGLVGLAGMRRRFRK